MAATALLLGFALAGGPTLARDGVARATIVVAKDATETERYAAEELARFLGEVIGDTPAITSRPRSKGPRLLVGPGAARAVVRNFTTDGLGEEGFVLRSVDDDLILAGGRPRGTLYAVYAFLEEQVGCRWWTSSASTIPSEPSLEIEPLDVRFVPRFEYRETFWFDAVDADWAARNRCNGHFEHLDARRGGKRAYCGFVHTFYALIPPATYFEEHPDWFAEVDGKRTHDRAQLCLTNEEMRRELVKNLRAELRKAPEAGIASVSQNDWYGWCQCARCAAVDEEEGSHAGTMLRFVNAVAEELEEEFPQVAFSTLAYQYTRKAPREVRPRPNVIVRLCSIECSFSVPLADPRNEAFRDDLVAWSEICDRLYVWDYTTNFAHHLLPHPNLRVLGPNVKFFAEHGVRGVFEQGAYVTPGAEMAPLRAWVTAKLLWTPERDADALVDEFLDGYFGPAAENVRSYLARTHDAVAEAGDPLGCFSLANAGFLTFELLRDGLDELDAAEEAVEGDAELLRRVQVARLPLLYAFLVRWKELRAAALETGDEWPLADSIEAVHREFLAVASAAKITHVAEWATLERLAEEVARAAAGE